MKHLFAFFALTFILASCGSINNGKLRFVKAQPQEIVSTEKESHSKSPMAILPEQIELEQQSEDLEQTKDELVISTEEKNIPVQELNPKVLIDDSLETVQNDQLEKALKTEKLSIKSTGMFIGGIVTSLIPFLGLVFFLLGISNYFAAKQERYNTLKGERYLSASKVLMIINAILVAFCIFLMITFVLAFI